jgi:hypothetical protein
MTSVFGVDALVARASGESIRSWLEHPTACHQMRLVVGWFYIISGLRLKVMCSFRWGASDASDTHGNG